MSQVEILERPCRVCGGNREVRPVMNALTGKQLKRTIGRELVFEIVCTGCGRRERRRTMVGG